MRRLIEYTESSHKRIAATIPLYRNLCSDFAIEWEYRIRKGRITKGNAITSCALIRRELINEIGFYDETLGPPFTIYENIRYVARALARRIHVVGFIEVLHNICEELEESPNVSEQ